MEPTTNRGPGWRGFERGENTEWLEFADSLDPCVAMSIYLAIALESRAPEGLIWSSDVRCWMCPPGDWERIILDHWPPLVKKKITPDRAIGVLRLEIEEHYAPRAAEEEWDRENAPRRSRWSRERRRIVSILERYGQSRSA